MSTATDPTIDLNNVLDAPPLGSPTPNHLIGFDMVWAITQNTINSSKRRRIA